MSRQGHPILSRARMTSFATPARRRVALRPRLQALRRDPLGPLVPVRVTERLEGVLVVARALGEYALRVLVRLIGLVRVRRVPRGHGDLVAELRERCDEHRTRVVAV